MAERLTDPDVIRAEVRERNATTAAGVGTGGMTELPMACSLDAAALAGRAAAWRAVLDGAAVEQTPAGGRARLPHDRRDEVERLVALEGECCPFFTFDVRPDGDALLLDVAAPEPALARELLAA